MGIRTWLFGKQSNNELVLISLRESNSELAKLLLVSQNHSAELLKIIGTLESALLNRSDVNSKSGKETNLQPTPKEQQVLNLLKEREQVTSADVCQFLGYSLRQVASKRMANMVAKGIVKKIGSGKNTAYTLP